jgi:hypothetical protein
LVAVKAPASAGLQPVEKGAGAGPSVIEQLFAGNNAPHSANEIQTKASAVSANPAAVRSRPVTGAIPRVMKSINAQQSNAQVNSHMTGNAI